MKTTLVSIIRLAVCATATALILAQSATAQKLRVDSVCVDSIWVNNTDPDSGLDCTISFTPRGTGTVLCSLSMSVDSGKTWVGATTQTYDPVSVPDLSLFTPFPTNVRSAITAHVFGGSKTGVAFKVTARQNAPIIAGNPWITVQGPTVTAGAAIQSLLKIRTMGDTTTYGYSTIATTRWDTLGGQTPVTITGENALSWTWSSNVPSGAAGQQRRVVVTAVDMNDLTSTPETLTVQFGLNRAFVMKDIPAGMFSMGDTSLDSSKPVHQVTLSAFAMQETPVTRELYISVMGSDPTGYKNSTADSMKIPVGLVTWFDAVLFCNAYSKLSGLDTCYTYTQAGATNAVCDFTKKGYRLPTEAEIEYATRAGSTTTYWWGADTSGMGESVSFDFMSGETFSKPRPVAMMQVNSFGLYDVVGNGWKWCNDWYGPYTAGAQTNPRGAGTGTEHCIRGGVWIGSMFILGDFFKSGLRDKRSANGKLMDISFTCVRTK
jgi:formylglycine-generating enzyme required for sulfatase activity